MAKAQASGRLTDATLAAAFVVAWSSGFIAGTLGTRSGSALTLLMWRFVIPAPLLLAWSRRRSVRPPSRPEVSIQLVVGLLAQGVYLAANVLALRLGVPAGTAALIAAGQPIVTGALVGPVLGERVTRAQWVGLVIATGGAAVVVVGDLGASHHVPVWAYGLPVAAMAALAAATLLQSYARAETPVGQSLAIQSAGSAVLFTTLALATHTAVPPSNSTFWIAVAWFVVLTVAGYALYWTTLARVGATKVSSLICLTPPATALWALALFGQPVSINTSIGMGISLVGVLLAVKTPIPGEAAVELVAPTRRGLGRARPRWAPHRR